MSPSSPPTIADLARWVERSGRRVARVSELAGDVSLRRYFRVHLEDGARAVLAWYPSELADRFAAFAQTTRLLSRVGVRVPEILDRSDDSSIMLLEDGGDVSVVDLELGSARVERCYARALDFAARIATIARSEVPASNPPLDESFLRRELDSTWKVFLDRELAGDAALRGELVEAFDATCAALGRLAARPCHRDLMARNLLATGGEATGAADELWVLDHQDLRLGPPFYDVASLLHDSTRLRPDQIERFERELVSAPERDDYARVCVQRLFKIVGTFHAFAARGYPRHLARVRPALRAALCKLSTLPEGERLAASLVTRWQLADPGIC